MDVALALHLLEEEQDDIIIHLVTKVRRSRHIMLRQRNEEGAFNTLITKYLLDDETKFHEFFRLTRNQFHFVLSAIRADIVKAPTRMVQQPITPEEKLGISLR